MDKKLLLPIVVSSLFINIIGVLLHRSFRELIMMLLYVCFFELSAFWLINRNLKSSLSYTDIIKRFNSYLIQTIWVQVLMLIYIVMRLYGGIEEGLLFFYSHVFIMFYAMGYILCISNAELKKRREER